MNKQEMDDILMECFNLSLERALYTPLTDPPPIKRIIFRRFKRLSEEGKKK